jgi:hypothetical protein
MNDFIEEPAPITRTLVPEERRLAVIEETFGAHFPLVIEPVTFTVAGKMADTYTGGLWTFFELSNSGFFMSPDVDHSYHVTSLNQYQCDISADGLGLVSCLTVFSHLSFSRNENLGRLCAKHYYLLREFSFQHPEVEAILRLTD